MSDEMENFRLRQFMRRQRDAIELILRSGIDRETAVKVLRALVHDFDDILDGYANRKWAPWFAWRPVQVQTVAGEKWVWCCKVERRETRIPGTFGDEILSEYREAEEREPS